MQRLSDLPRVTSESVAGTEWGALTQRRLLSAQGNATQLLLSLQPGLSHPPLLMTPVNFQWVTVCYEFSTIPRRMSDFSGRRNYTPGKTSPREGGLRHTEEEHREKLIQACGTSEQLPPRDVSHPPSFRPSYPSPHTHKTLLCAAESNCLHRTGLCVSLAAGNAG